MAVLSVRVCAEEHYRERGTFALFKGAVRLEKNGTRCLGHAQGRIYHMAFWASAQGSVDSRGPRLSQKTKCGRGTSATSSGDEENIRAVTSVYEAQPIRGIFSDAQILNKCMMDMVSEINDKLQDLPPILRIGGKSRWQIFMYKQYPFSRQRAGAEGALRDIYTRPPPFTPPAPAHKHKY
ncbi:hypothetical protein EVAR_94926_1 [Eumeta japonica]|uniref:Uncharacterized protein n=1 Tax=Eumeta variegata TaxID=151549 RepID=A0A4C1Z399_EUMVA|nr:hypothetical protein EVAR_94926_1 [Eumeta japonica]